MGIFPVRNVHLLLKILSILYFLRNLYLKNEVKHFFGWEFAVKLGQCYVVVI